MNKATLEAQVRKLRTRREELIAEVKTADSALDEIGGDRDIEPEERAQKEDMTYVLSRLEDRSRREVEEIDAALHRIQDHHYGKCVSCGGAIGISRLRALPTATLCVACASGTG